MNKPLNIIIIEKIGTVKSFGIKDFKINELYKKCGFKKGEDFLKQVEWSIKHEGNKYYVEVYAKTNGRPNSENKYDFPPPIDTKLFFGNCAVITYVKEINDNKVYKDLTISLWNKFYEKLFGGFEDLSTTAIEDENEVDELENVPKEKKTKQGYLKDGFVVDSSDTEENGSVSSYTTDDNEDLEEEEKDNWDHEQDIIVQDLGVELSEEPYDYN